MCCWASFLTTGAWRASWAQQSSKPQLSTRASDCGSEGQRCQATKPSTKHTPCKYFRTSTCVCVCEICTWVAWACPQVAWTCDGFMLEKHSLFPPWPPHLSHLLFIPPIPPPKKRCCHGLDGFVCHPPPPPPTQGRSFLSFNFLFEWAQQAAQKGS